MGVPLERETHVFFWKCLEEAVIPKVFNYWSKSSLFFSLLSFCSYIFLWNLSDLLFSYFLYLFIAFAASMVSEGVHQAEIGIIARRGWRKSRMHGSPGGAPGAAKACPRTPKTEQTQKNIKNMIVWKVVNIRWRASTHEKHHFYLSKINIFDFSTSLF